MPLKAITDMNPC